MSQAQRSTSVTQQRLISWLRCSVFFSPAKSRAALWKCCRRSVQFANWVQLLPFGFEFLPGETSEAHFFPMPFRGRKTRCKNLMSEIKNKVERWKTNLTQMGGLHARDSPGIWDYLLPTLIFHNAVPQWLSVEHKHNPAVCFAVAFVTSLLLFLLIPCENKLNLNQTKKKKLFRSAATSWGVDGFI